MHSEKSHKCDRGDAFLQLQMTNCDLSAAATSHCSHRRSTEIVSYDAVRTNTQMPFDPRDAIQNIHVRICCRKISVCLTVCRGRIIVCRTRSGLPYRRNSPLIGPTFYI